MNTFWDNFAYFRCTLSLDLRLTRWHWGAGLSLYAVSGFNAAFFRFSLSGRCLTCVIICGCGRHSDITVVKPRVCTVFACSLPSSQIRITVVLSENLKMCCGARCLTITREPHSKECPALFSILSVFHRKGDIKTSFMLCLKRFETTETNNHLKTIYLQYTSGGK